MVLYMFARFFGGLFFRIVYRFRITGLENIPSKGPVILCCNHASAWDPIFICIAVPRWVRFIAKAELFSNPLFALVLRTLGLISVDRGETDMTMFKKSLDVLKRNQALGIFAQGRRTKDIDVNSAKSGVALFALKAGCDIVPMSCISEYKLFKPVIINIGEPISMKPYKDMKIRTPLLNEITEKVMTQISELSRK